MWHVTAGGAVPVGSFGVGTYATYFNQGNVVAWNQDRTLKYVFRPYDFAIHVSAGRRLGPLGYGLGLKVIRSFLAPGEVVRAVFDREGSGTAVSFALDAGLLLRSPFGVNLSLAVQNLGPSLEYRGMGIDDPLPSFVRMGVAVKPLQALGVRSGFFSITLAYDVNKSIHDLGRQIEDFGTRYAWNDAWKHYGLDFTFGPGPVTFSYRAGFYHDLHGGKGWMGVFPLIPPFASDAMDHPLVYNAFGFEIRFYYIRFSFADDSWITYPDTNLGTFRFSFSVVSPLHF
jgi:hypothetical protein